MSRVCLGAALHAERHQVAVAVDRLAVLRVVLGVDQAQVLAGQLVQRMALEAQVVDPLDLRWSIRNSATAMVLRLNMSTLERRVRMSLSDRMAFIGERFCPLSRLGRVLRYMAKSAFISSGPNLLVMFLRAITAPAMPKPDEVRVLVTDWMTMSAPWASGRSSAGVPTVLSMISGSRGVGQLDDRLEIEEGLARVGGQLAVDEAGVLVDLATPTRRDRWSR